MISSRIEAFLDKHGLRPARVVLAVSGGFDSTAMLLGFLDVPGVEITCAHVNHHLRGVESDEDEAFVRELCERHGVPLTVVDGSLDASAIGRAGIEGAARETRYARLREIATDFRADYIATAHHLNDQAETVMMRVVTGSGIGGLRGIHPIRDDGVIRPLLGVTRGEIEHFLRERGVAARTDRSNADPRFLRNRIRDVLRDFDDAALANIAGLADQARQLWPVVERAIDDAERQFVRATESETRFDGWPEDVWMRQALLHRHIARMSASREVSSRDLERLASSIDSIRRVTVTRDLELVRQRDALVLRHPPEDAEDFELVIAARKELTVVAAGQHTIAIRRTAWREPRSNERQRQLIQLPDGANGEFTIRNRRSGDRFRPLGLAHDKKLKDFLIDRKIAPELRDRIPLLIWNGIIVWVAGVEVSDDFKVTSPAGELYEVTVEDESHSQNRAGIHS